MTQSGRVRVPHHDISFLNLMTFRRGIHSFQNLDFFWSSSGLLLVCFTKTKRRVKEDLERGKRWRDFIVQNVTIENTKFYFHTIPIHHPYRIHALSIHYPYRRGALVGSLESGVWRLSCTEKTLQVR